jgi:Zn-finger nucleic acid-binding protein
MNCPNCGAALRPVGNRNYFRCPYCETFHFPDEMEDGVALVAGEAPHDCPVCAKHLVPAAIEGHAVSYCATCRGFLAGNATFSKVVRIKRSKCAGAPHVPLPFGPEELTRRVKCPRCAKPMDTHPYHAGGNAVIDTCHRCRLVWLDAGELTVLGKYQGRSGPQPVPPERGPESKPWVAEPEPEPVVISLFGFPIRLG